MQEGKTQEQGGYENEVYGSFDNTNWAAFQQQTSTQSKDQVRRYTSDLLPFFDQWLNTQ